jgi:hypothetical protein
MSLQRARLIDDIQIRVRKFERESLLWSDNNGEITNDYVQNSSFVVLI